MDTFFCPIGVCIIEGSTVYKQLESHIYTHCVYMYSVCMYTLYWGRPRLGNQ